MGPNRARKRGREGRACRANDDDNDGVLVGRKGGGRSRNNLGQSKHLLVRRKKWYKMLVRQLFYLLRLTRTAQKDEGKINGRLAQLDPFLPWKEDHIFLSRKEARSSIIFGFVSTSSSLLQKERGRRIPPFFAESSGHHLLLRGFTAAEGEVGHFEFQKRGGGESAGHQVAIEE